MEKAKQGIDWDDIIVEDRDNQTEEKYKLRREIYNGRIKQIIQERKKEEYNKLRIDFLIEVLQEIPKDVAFQCMKEYAVRLVKLADGSHELHIKDEIIETLMSIISRKDNE